MTYLFYGDDTFSINEKSNALIKKFTETHSDLNILQLDGASLNLENFLQAALTLPFLGSAKLIVVRNLLLENKDNELKKEIAKNLGKIPKSSTVLFIEQGNPDMRSVLFKALNQPKMAQKFELMVASRLGGWIMERVKEEGGEISSAARSRLEVMIGPDLWRLKNEIEKLVLFKRAMGGSSVIEVQDVESMVAAENNSTIFQFTDALAQNNIKQSAAILSNLINSGEDPFYVFTMVVYQFRNLMFVAELGNFSPQEIASKAKLHPFVVRKNKDLLRRYKKEDIKKILLKLQELDCQIKTGLISPTLALDLLPEKIS